MSPFYKIENTNVRALRYDPNTTTDQQLCEFVAWNNPNNQVGVVSVYRAHDHAVMTFTICASSAVLVRNGDWLISPAPGIFFGADLGEHADVFLGRPLTWEAWDSAQHHKPVSVIPNPPIPRLPPNPVSQDVLAAIASEKTHQLSRHGNHVHTPAEWLLILEKLMSDARHAWVTGNGDLQAMHEIRQIATTALAAMEQCGAPVRIPLGQPGKLPGEP